MIYFFNSIPNFMVRTIILSILILITSNILMSQNSQIDSLELRIKEYKIRDTTRVNLLTEIAHRLFLSNTNKSLKYAFEAKDLSDSLNFITGKGASIHIIGLCYYIKGAYQLSVDYFQKSLQIKQQLKDTVGVSKCLNNLGSVFYQLEKYPEALEYYKKSLKLFEVLNNKQGVASALNNIGGLYILRGDNINAKASYNKALTLSEELDDKQSISANLNNIGNVYLREGDYNRALSYFKKSFDLVKDLGDDSRMATGYNNIAQVYIATNNPLKAITYLKNSIDICNKIGTLDNQKENYFFLSNAYLKLGNYEGAYKNYVLYKHVYDSIFNKQNIAKITELTLKFEHEKELQAKKLELQKKEAVMEERLKREKLQRYGMYLIIVIIILVFLHIYRTNSIITKANTQRLLDEINMLQAYTITKLSISKLNDIELRINKHKLEKSINGVLNESDWKIINALCKKPTIKNREIANKISLSTEGVRSSLKKMYRLFNIQGSSDELRMKLVLKIYKYLEEES